MTGQELKTFIAQQLAELKIPVQILTLDIDDGMVLVRFVDGSAFEIVIKELPPLSKLKGIT